MIARLLIVSIAIVACLGAATEGGGLSQERRDRGSLTGIVLRPDGRAAEGGSVRLVSAGSEVEVQLGRTGGFRFERLQAGMYELQVRGSDAAMRQVKVTVPVGRELVLPSIRLTEPVFVRVRLLTPAGEAIVNPGVAYRLYERNGLPIPERFGERIASSTDAAGVTHIGPLPRGIFVFAIDAPPWARARLPDVVVNGQVPSIDLGAVRMEPGVALDVDVRDENGAPVPGHSVSLGDDSPLLPALHLRAATNARGRARFERLAGGTYRVRTSASRTCGLSRPTVERRITIGGGAVPAPQRLVIGGVKVTVRIVSAGVPLPSTIVRLGQEIAPPSVPSWLRAEGERLVRWSLYTTMGPPYPDACGDTTDRDGVVTIGYVPSGPARASVQFANSTWVRRVLIPEQDGSITLEAPQGVVSLRVVDDSTGEAVGGGAITWVSNRGEVNASVPAAGDALVEGIPDGPARLVIRKDGYQQFEARFPQPPPILYSVALHREPDRRLQCRVQDSRGQPVERAVVEVVPSDALEPVWYASTDGRGLVQFGVLPPGTVRLTATARGSSNSASVVATVPTSPATRVIALTVQ